MADEQRRPIDQRAAYARYVAYQWRLYRLSPDDPARPALAAVVTTADRRWRALAGVPDLRGHLAHTRRMA